MLDIKRVIASAPQKPNRSDVQEHNLLQPLFTSWGKDILAKGITEKEEAEGMCPQQRICPQPHPHPQFEREHFQMLDGHWEYCIISCDNAQTAWQTASTPDTFDGTILVPFSPEAPLSGVNRQLQPNELLWYRRSFAPPPEFHIPLDDTSLDGMPPDCSPSEDTSLDVGKDTARNRCILHFEAVDYACACYCNGICVGTHVGGYLPFSLDITDMLGASENEISLCVYDPSDEGVQLRGKQKLERGGIWYTAQSGIWQSVWLEVVPESHIDSLDIDTQADSGHLVLTATVHDSLKQEKTLQPRAKLTARLLDGAEEIARATSSDIDSPFLPNTYTLAFDIADPHLWSPDDPHLYRLELTYGSDTVLSYCAFRTITMEYDAQGFSRLCINHEPVFLRGVLDQGYWPDGLMSAPSDDALVFDIQTMKDLGFNMARKHIKIESDRWYYHCDRLGMLVWQDMVCGGGPLSPWHTSYKPTLFRWSWGHYADDTPRHYRNLAAGSDAFRTEWTDTCADTVTYLKNHPSIITWVLFNEGWGQFEARKATARVRSLDASRPIDAVSGWYDQSCGDFLSVHNYFRPLAVYKDSAQPHRAFIISEFGGLSHHIPEHSSLASSYGYATLSDLSSFKVGVETIIKQADDLENQGLVGYVYTQLSDVEEETNGLMTYDRRINKLADKDQL